jgi:GNAT superfamily N-acetyltransferase
MRAHRFLAFGLQFCFDDDDEPEYLALYCYEVQVRRSHQGGGLGKYMIQELISVAKTWKMEKVVGFK